MVYIEVHMMRAAAVLIVLDSAAKMVYEGGQ